MILGDLKRAFVQKKGYQAQDENELLDFARQQYLEGKICISEYRKLTQELETNGATKPAYTIAES